MDSLSPKKSILDFVAIHQRQICRQCGLFVGCVRLTRTPVYQDGQIRFWSGTKTDSCHLCQIKAAGSDDERDRLQADHGVMRAMRIELGLGDTQADRSVKEALRMRRVLTATLWVEQVPTTKTAIMADIYTVLCDGIDLPSEDEGEQRIPSFTQSPALSLYWADPPDFAGAAFVAIAANVWRPDIPQATIRLRWSPFNPTDYTTFQSYGHFNAVRADHRTQLISAASTLFARWMPDARGRPRGSGRFYNAQDFESAVFAAVAALSKQKRRITQDTVGTYLISKRGRNRAEGDSPADPGRQFREWCTAFKCNSEDLIQRALDACASGK